MKNRIINIILIILIVGIYSSIVLKYTGKQSGNSFLPEEVNTYEISGPDSSVNKSFTLSHISNDPFLKDEHRVPVKRHTPNNKSTIKPNNKNKLAEPAPKPNIAIKYMGQIKNLNNSKTVILISFNGKSVRMSQGDIHDNFRLDKIYKDSCLLISGKEKFIVKR